MPLLPDGRFRFDDPAELPPVALSFGTTAWNRTGAWRSREPAFGDLRPPCAAACPAGQDIADQLRLVAQGKLREAGALLLRANPFPSTTGRVCPHPCTARCNRAPMDGALDVPGVERAIGDALLGEPAAAADAGRGPRVAIVGAGPAGLAAAYYLARGGCAVTVYDRAPRPGGLLRYGIPPYRLPRDVLDGEVGRALAGARFVGERALGCDLALDGLAAEHDAVLLALGRHAPRPLGVPGEAAAGLCDGLRLLDGIHQGGGPPAGRRVVVVGGGNTAIDCARTLRRAGRDVTVAYRRGRDAMPALPDELEEALEEGVRLETWALPAGVEAPGGRLRALLFVRARPGAPDASGRPRPEPIPGSEFTLPADVGVVAAGEELDREGLPEPILRRGWIAADAELRTPLDRTFACGDCLGGGGTVAEAIGQGRRAAAAIALALGAEVVNQSPDRARRSAAGPDARSEEGEYLAVFNRRATTQTGPPREPGDGRGLVHNLSAPSLDVPGERGAAADVAGFDLMRPWRFDPAAPIARGRLAPEVRLGGGEVRLGFAGEAARAEAARCLSCGTCTGCDLCFHYCPDQAVRRAAPGGYGFDPARCKGCGVCVEECPRGAVKLREIGGGDGE